MADTFNQKYVYLIKDLLSRLQAKFQFNCNKNIIIKITIYI